MFEKEPPKRSIKLGVLVPVVTVLVAGLVALFIYLSPETPLPRTDQLLEGMVHSGDPEFDRYLEFVKLEDTKVSLALNFSGNRSVIFSGTFQNLGRRSVDAVEVKLTLFNYEKPVWDTVRTVYRPSSRNEPIRPYQSCRLSLYLEDLPKEWQSSHAEIEIHGLRFEGWKGEPDR